jgi:hypothetical protein
MSNTVTWQEALLTVEKLSWTDQLRLVSELLQRMQSRVVEHEPVDRADQLEIDPEFARQVSEFIEQYRPALDALAK